MFEDIFNICVYLDENMFIVIHHYFMKKVEGFAGYTMAVRKPGVIALFDVDGTLTAPRKVYISPGTKNTLYV